MRMTSTFTGALCGAVAMAALPSEVTAGPIGAPVLASVGATTSVELAHYRAGGYYRGAYGRHYRPGYGAYRGAGAAAGIAGAAAGALGAGIAGASGYGYPGYGGYGYPSYGYGGGAGGNSCWQWNAFTGWVWGCR